MDERRLRVALIATAAVMIAAAIVYVVVRPTMTAPEMPSDPHAIALRLARHPADWQAASALTEHALDAPVADRLALWRDAHEVALHLAPNREAPRVAFAKSAFFHWSELTPADRAKALDDLEPVLHDEGIFMRMLTPLFELTGNLEMLRRSQPGTVMSTLLLEQLAAMYGRFDDYRALRAELQQKRSSEFSERVSKAQTGGDVIDALPSPPYRAGEQPMIVAALRQLHAKPLDIAKRPDVLGWLIEYSTRHHLGPLDGLAIVVRSSGSVDDIDRYRLAEGLGERKAADAIRMVLSLDAFAGKWDGTRADLRVRLRGSVDLNLKGATAVTLEATRGDDVPPYVEIYLDDALVAEGEVRAQRTFTFPATAGAHHLEVDVANPMTRNDTPREVRVISVAP